MDALAEGLEHWPAGYEGTYSREDIYMDHEVPLQKSILGKEGREPFYTYAATPNRLATNFACPCESLPANLLT